MENHSHQEQPSHPPLCAAGCGFFGNQATQDLCSKCYRELQQREKEKEQVLAAQPVLATSIQPVVGPVVEEAGPGVAPPAVAVEENPSVVAVEENPPAVAVEENPSVVVDETLQPNSDQQGPPVQKNRSRCFSCNKKVGLLGFDCKCGYVFCSAHRHASSSDKDGESGHKCTFRWQDFDRKILADSMEVVAPKKIEKL